jgi:hypothetical protein
MSGTGGASGTGTGGTTGGAAPFKPCADTQRIGAFTLDLKHADAATSNPAYSQVNGGVRDGVIPSSIWVESPVTGAGNGCKLMVGPTNACSPACSTTQVCKAGTCQPAPVTKSVGEVTFSGLVTAVKMTPMTNGSGVVVYSGLIPSSTAYPPYTVGATLGLMAAGADYPAFSLTGMGIAPLEVPTQALNVAKDQPLTIKWMAPGAGKGRIELIMDIAHHGGVSAEIHCDLEDNGTVTIPAPLITALMDKGTFGFPTVSLTRLSVDSMTVGPGCVEYNVAAGLELPLSVAGVVSCNDDTGCTPPQHCIVPGYKCGS